MNRTETARVLFELSTAFEHTKPRDAELVTDALAHQWHDALAHVDPDTGLEAARLIVTTDRWFPTLARFMETVGSIRRRTLMDRPAVSDRSEIEVTDEEAKALLAGIREMLKKVGRTA